jgi:hypothetical protein
MFSFRGTSNVLLSLSNIPINMEGDIDWYITYQSKTQKKKERKKVIMLLHLLQLETLHFPSISHKINACSLTPHQN